ncbi:hypothetical protein P154DRAFT_623635 [Amniculicola lignicola CBS 123094]|uniref:Uncharacterized protein n=1 Tax=Amniculicola lignicola CBS 123094 TaxID=1392246 RepID=A0A6A5W4M8_9PLEO|nr:hypothetical protein P154DRAFT_623635 [Amniculicola lignicola CBS 123094]
MKRSGSNRVPRKIGGGDEASGESELGGGDQAQIKKAGSVVKRPVFGKNKKRSSFRMSFGPEDADANDGSDIGPTVVTPKKTTLSRIAIEKSAELRTRSPLVAEVPRDDKERPTYSQDYLAELRKSTPTLPKELPPGEVDEYEPQIVILPEDLEALPELTASEPSAILTEAEIQEKKDRRARRRLEKRAHQHLGEEPEDNLLDDEEADEFRRNDDEISFRPKAKWGESRLVREDEDILEGFDEFVDDGRIALGRKAERAARKNKRAEMEAMINDAEGSEEEDSSDSEAERNAAYEAAQMKAGTGKVKIKAANNGARTPPRIAPLPDLGDVLASLHAEVRNKQQRREQMLKKLKELKEREIELADRKQYVQGQLEKTGQEYERLRAETGMAALPVSNGTDGGRIVVNRGLDSLGATPVISRGESSEEDDYE